MTIINFHENFNTKSINKRDSDRRFGFIFSFFFFMFGLLPVAHHKTPKFLPLFIGLLFFSISTIKPMLLFHFNNAWFNLGKFLQKMTSFFFLLTLFLCVFTPMSFLLKILGKDLLLLKGASCAKTFWRVFAVRSGWR